MSRTPLAPRLHHLLLLVLTVSAVLLALPAASVARAHKSSCHPTSTTHSKHAARKCSQSAHKTKPTHAKHRHPGRPRLKANPKAHPKTTAGKEESEGASEAFCADGSTPLASEEGTFACEDGSAPECEAGLVEVLSSNASTLLCETPASEEQES
jgi:hypothetical protein